MIGRISRPTLQLSALLAVLGTTAGQSTLSGLIEGPTGRPLAGARVAFFDDPAPQVVQRPPFARLPVCEAHTDAAGRFRLRRDGAPFRSGAVWAEAGGGLCAFLPVVLAGRPLRVRLAAGSPVRTTPAGDGELQALALVADAPPCHLGTLAADAGLPPGRFRLLQRAACGWNEHDVIVQAGVACVLPAARPPAQFVTVPATFDGEVRLPGWPAAAIALAVRDERVAVPPGPSPRQLLFFEPVGPATLVREVVFGGTPGTLVLPPRGDRTLPLQVRAAATFSAPPLAAAIEPDGSRWKVRAWCALTRDGEAFVGELPLPPETTAVLISSPGFAPSWQTLDEVRSPTTLIAGRRLTVQIEPDAAATPRSATIELAHLEAPWLVLTASTDAIGRVAFDDLPAGSVRLRVQQPGRRQAQRDVELRAGDTAVRIALQPGAELHGAVALTNGSPAAHAVVVLRDPTGTLRIEPMRAFADAQGRFAFGGLPEDAPMTLFASLERDGRTWSAQRHGVRSGDEIELRLQLEDPAPPDARRRDR